MNPLSRRVMLFVIVLVTAIAGVVLMAMTVPTRSVALSQRSQSVTPFPTFPTYYPPALRTQAIAEWQHEAALRLTPTITGTSWTLPLFPDTPAATPTYAGTSAGNGVIDDSCTCDAAPDALGKALGIWARNAWFAVIDGQQIAVFAGSTIDESSTGMILVLINDNQLPGGSRFLTPHPGAVRIVGAQGQRLTLLSDQGQTYYFDIPSLQFTDSPSAIMPTITPLPPGPSLTPTLYGDAPHQPFDVHELSPINVPLPFALYHPGDLEWFAFRAPVAGTIQVHLNNLSTNYDLYVYSTDYSDYKGQSTNPGTTPEMVVINNAPADVYMVQVASVNGSFDPNHPYQLEFDVLGMVQPSAIPTPLQTSTN